MGKVEWMFWASRPFALPWIFVNTLLGATLAGMDWLKFFVAFVIVGAILVASHYINSWRDYVKGFDTLDNGSTPKSYTAASQILPKGLLDTSDVTRGALAMLTIAFALMVVYAPKRIDVWGLFILGVFLALTYTDFWKPKGLGELALFLGHGWGASTFAYALIKPVGLDAMSVGVILGILAALVYTLDQYPDVETDFGKKAKDLAYLMFHAEVKPSSYLWFSVTAVSSLTVAFVLLGWLPSKMLTALFTLPIFHVAGLVLDYDYGRGVLIGLVGIWLFALVPAIVLLLF